MVRKSNDSISITLSEDTLKVSHVKGIGSSAKIINAIAQDIKGVDEVSLPKIINVTLKGFPVKSANVYCVIDPSVVTTKNIEIPSIEPEEIKSIVNLQAGRHTPFSREEIEVDFINIGVYKTNYTKVLLIIVNKNILKKQLEVLDKVGLKINKVIFPSEAIASFYSKALDLENKSLSVGIIDVGADSTNFVIAFRGLAIASRSIPVGKNQLLKEDLDYESKLIEELKKTLESYKNEDIEQVPSKYILANMQDEFDGLKDMLKEKLNWEVEAISYVDNIKATQGALKRLGVDFGNNSFLDLVVSSVEAEEVNIDLMPEEVQFQKTIEEQGKEAFKTATLGFVVLILIACVLGLKIYFQNSFLNKIKDELRANRQEVMALEQRSLETRIIKSYLASRMIGLDVVNELYLNVPNEMYLTNISMNEDGVINIQGISDIASLVFNLGTTLKESELFKSADIKSMTAKKDRNKDTHAFEIELKLESAFEEEVEKPLIQEE
ncbi:MAG: pilus assembly protein PilM [Candidatus Zapsychrus exili]|nr:pilus assembly protein PilM [Candidatus Zapsychrus exili]